MSTSRTHEGPTRTATVPAPTSQPSRRAFLRAAAVGSAAALVACGDDDLPVIGPPTRGSGAAITLDFRSEIDVLRYASALEELEGAFYDEVVKRLDSGTLTLPATEATLVREQRENELVHRVFFRQALGAQVITPTPNIAAAGNLNDRVVALTLLQKFCDTGVSAYNGSGRYLTAANLTVAGKIVAMEARHVAAIRDLLQPNSAAFAGDDVVDVTTGLDWVNGPNTQAQGLEVNLQVANPNTVIAAAAPYTTSRLTVVNF